ncbi:hypothetical protein MMC28_002527 [Mycoblastus sanguinarius]|nr:hypothetical protein [Mycoblastus sanguinarius]
MAFSAVNDGTYFENQLRSGKHEGKLDAIIDFFLNIFTADNLARIAAQFDDVLAAYPEGAVYFQGNPPGERPEPQTLKNFFTSYKTADSTELEAIFRAGYRSQAPPSITVPFVPTKFKSEGGK